MGKKSFRDVRMRGFAERAVVETACAWVDSQAAVRASEEVAARETVVLAGLHRRVLAGEIVSSIAVPAFDRCAMDGYALCGRETNGATDYSPLTFDVIGDALPGEPFAGAVSSGTAVRVMTGSPLPRGADAVLPAEYAEEIVPEETGGDADRAGSQKNHHRSEKRRRVVVTAAVSPCQHVGRCGEDISSGQTILRAGRRLRPQDVGLLASVGIDRAVVVRRPRVRVVVTGNELVEAGKPRGASQIYEANSHLLRGLIARDGGELESIQQVDDSREAIREAICKPGADVLLVSGGSSVGAEDFAPSIVAEEGELAIHGIAMRPSSPTGMGRIGETILFLLPGNPVSCLCAYDFFAGRCIRLLGGLPAEWPYRSQRMMLGRKIVSAVGRVDYCRVCYCDGLTNDGAAVDAVEPLALSGASILSSTTRADGFVVIPAASEGFAAKAVVTVFWYDDV